MMHVLILVCFQMVFCTIYNFSKLLLISRSESEQNHLVISYEFFDSIGLMNCSDFLAGTRGAKCTILLFVNLDFLQVHVIMVVY